MFEKTLAERSPLKSLSIVSEETVRQQLSAVPQLMDLCREADVVIAAPLCVCAVAATRAVGTLHVSAHLAPLHRARGYSPLGTNFGRIANSLLWSLASVALRNASDDVLNQVVRAAGLPPWRNILLSASHSPALDLVAVSPVVLPKDPAWGPTTHVTGSWFADDPTPPSVELRAFVERAPPVVVGFGSMMGFDAEEKTRRVLDAVKNLDDPVVLMSGWAGLGQMELPSHVRVAGYVPHAWLFSRARCVVHHGGAGTTAAALRAGIPQTIVWHLGDQPMWGQRVERLGVGPRARNHAKADAAYLRASIERMLRDEAMRERARALGAQVAGEDGLGRARRAVEALFHARQRDGSSAEPPQLGGRVN